MIRRKSSYAITSNYTKKHEIGRGVFVFTLIAAVITLAALRDTALRVVIIGDSTAYTYPASDSLRGWGQELGFFFNPGSVTVINKSIGGRSSRSFIEDGHWASTKAILKKGDILLISFGTNDRGTVPERHADTAQFRQYLTQYINESRAIGAIPVLISTVNQNSWNGTTFVRGFATGSNDYRGAMLRVVKALDVPFIDLEQKTAELFMRLGQSYLSNFFFIGGNTHFQEMGALNIAKLVAEGIKELGTHPDISKLAASLAPQYMLNVTSNKSGAGMITASGTYPQGAPITLKVVPNSGEIFKEWQDGMGKSLSTQKLYKFTMDAKASSYMAIFKGDSTSAGFSEKPLFISNGPSVIISYSGKVSITSNDVILEVRVLDFSGKSIQSCNPNHCHYTLNISFLPHGTYIVSVRTTDGMTKHLVKL